MQKADRRLDLERAKGLGILLVVFGHIVARDPPQGNAWYEIAKTAIYTFHMPFFMYLSGYVTFLSGAARVDLGQWPQLAARRAQRLLLPFAVFGLAIVAGKLAASRFLYVDNLPPSVPQALVDLLWYTDFSPAISIWYMFVLFVACAVTPVLLRLLRGRTALLLVLALALYAVGLPHRLYADRVARYFAFFVMGGLAVEAGERWLGIVDRTWIAAASALAVAAAIAVLFPAQLSEPWARLLCGALSMPALHGLIRRTRLSRSSWLLALGSYSFVIYLLNTPFIGLAKGLLLKSMSWDGTAFLLFAPLLMLAGTLGPVLAKRWLFRPVPALDRLTS
jgi:fucose 4-O-acetylase-like acetyltransferase